MIAIKYFRSIISQLEGKSTLQVHLKDIYPSVDTSLNVKGYIYSVELLNNPFRYINVLVYGTYQIPKDILRHGGKIAITFSDVRVEKYQLENGTSQLFWSASKILILGGI